MGKGDKRTKRGKIFAGSYGKSRPKPHTAAFVAVEKPVIEKAPKKRTPKVVKSAPAPEPVSEQGAVASGSAGTEGVSATEQTTDTPRAETAEPTAAAPASGGDESQNSSEEAAA
jgi:30S ribosomal protein S31